MAMLVITRNDRERLTHGRHGLHGTLALNPNP